MIDPRRIALAVALLSIVSPLAAFETLGNPWRNGGARYRINPNFPETARSGTADEQIEFLRSAADAWENQSTANWAFTYDGTTDKTGVNLSDSVNAVSWIDDDSDGALAATFLRFDGQGRIAKFDMVFYDRTEGVKNDWSGPGEPGGPEIDIVGIAVHEFGHALGLDHTEDRDATMFRSLVSEGLHLRTLADDDLAGVHFLYGAGRPGADPLPSIRLVNPDIGSASGGDEVIIRGRNFTWTSNTTLRIDGVEVPRTLYDVDGLELIRIRSMPAGDVGPATISIDNTLGFTALPEAYRYGQPAPELAGVEPPVGPIAGGVPVTVRGRWLTEEASVTIGGKPLESPEFVDDETITGTLPAATSSGPVDVVLVQGEDTVMLTDGFEYTARLLQIADTDVPAGSRGFPVDVLATSDEALGGVSFGLTYDIARVSVANVIVTGTAAEGAAFASPNIENANGVTTFGIVMTFVPPGPTIPSGDDVLVARVLVTLEDSVTAGETVELTLADRVGSPPVELFFTPAGSSEKLVPHALSGSLSVIDGPLFIRGDVNGSFTVELTDAVALLDALFRAGELGSCLDASDANDDGKLDIADAVRILVALFAGGPQPPAPYPAPGLDPTDDSLDC